MPTVLFADDPTAALHRDEREQVLRILASAARSHRITLVLATHDPDQARHADRTVVLVDGRLEPTAAEPAAAASPAVAAGR
jgi:putative ABC transport system ATP-binding protein